MAKRHLSIRWDRAIILIASSKRLPTPACLKTGVRCARTVHGLMPSSLAICLSDFDLSNSQTTCDCRSPAQAHSPHPSPAAPTAPPSHSPPSAATAQAAHKTPSPRSRTAPTLHPHAAAPATPAARWVNDPQSPNPASPNQTPCSTHETSSPVPPTPTSPHSPANAHKMPAP